MTAPAKPKILSPNCLTAIHPRTPPGWAYGHGACQAPGYRHPILGFMKVTCECECHGGTQ